MKLAFEFSSTQAERPRRPTGCRVFVRALGTFRRRPALDLLARGVNTGQQLASFLPGEVPKTATVNLGALATLESWTLGLPAAVA